MPFRRLSTGLPAAVLAAALVTVLALAAAPAGAQRREPPHRPDPLPIVIAHRGASGYLPEHTLAAYELAIRMGADYVEPDLVATKDGYLVARHENEIGGTTDVAEHPEFADRYTTKTIDGTEISGWFTEDFTLAELKTLRAVERIPDLRPGNTAYDGRYEIPTLEEILRLVRRVGRGRVGVYPETKHPTYFQSIGLPLEERLVEVLSRNGYRGRTARVYIQSFEVANLRRLDTLTDLPLVQLVNASGRPYDFTVAGDPRTYADLVTPAGLAEVATYADGVGLNKDLVIPREPDGSLGAPTGVVADAHAAGLLVHAWTFRAENAFLPTDLRVGDDPAAHGDLATELERFFAAGLDGVFSDHPDVAVAVRDDLFGVPRWRLPHTAGGVRSSQRP